MEKQQKGVHTGGSFTAVTNIGIDRESDRENLGAFTAITDLDESRA
jgi:hypothetical protein